MTLRWRKRSFLKRVSRKSAPFHSFCSFIDSGTIERKQITLYLAFSFHLLIIIISRSLSYLLAIGPWPFPWDPTVCRVGVQPLRRELVTDRRGSRPFANANHRRKISIWELASKGKLPLNFFLLRGKKAFSLFLHARRIREKSWLQDSAVTGRIHVHVLMLGFPL